MDAKTIIFGILGAYLALGIIAIATLDIITHRVRKRIKGASVETQAMTGESKTVAFIVTVGALWILWPCAIYAAIKG